MAKVTRDYHITIKAWWSSREDLITVSAHNKDEAMNKVAAGLPHGWYIDTVQRV